MNINTIVVLDTETTGVDPAAGAALLEVAWVPLVREPRDQTDAWDYGAPGESFVEFLGEIPPEARAVHHIRPEDVAPGAPNVLPRMSLIGEMIRADTPQTVYAAHNAAFDRQFLLELASFDERDDPTLPPRRLCRPWICTWRCALHLWPEAPAHGNQVLRYWRGVRPLPTLLERAPHRALYDAGVTAALLLDMLAGHSAEELLELSARPVLLRTVRFGKHRGTPWAEVPRDYLRWVLGQDFDADVAHTARHYLEGGRRA